MRSFNQPRHRHRRQRESAINDFECEFSAVDSAAPSCILAAHAAAAAELGGECNPTPGTEGLSEIRAAVSAPPRHSATAAAASHLGDGEYSPSAMGTGLSRFGATIAAASCNPTVVAALPRDSAAASAASQAAAD